MSTEQTAVPVKTIVISLVQTDDAKRHLEVVNMAGEGMHAKYIYDENQIDEVLDILK